jgi:hypothetical protein
MVQLELLTWILLVLAKVYHEKAIRHHHDYISHASAVAQGNVVRAMSASYGKSLYSTFRRSQTP